ncbi:MAG: acyl-CoA dehydrogenase [Pseudonocardia sp. SCN 72-86]|nr:MAG: acyl-CoA dehydrogenase [Pseudonocardia sp. SCN 72-86]
MSATSLVWEPELSRADAAWRDLARRLTADHFAPLAAEIDRDQRYPWESVAQLANHRLTGMFLPQAYGGEGASLTAACAVAEEISRGCAATCTVWMSYVVGAMPLLLAGTEDQRKRFLTEVAAGQGISFALTERHTGSDASKVVTSATREGSGWRLRGEKWMVGNGGPSRFYTVFARIDGDDRLTAFLVDREEGGVVIDDSMDKMGLRGATTTNLRLDCLVPEDNQLGDRGRGLSIALRSLSTGRILAAGQACGISLGVFEEAARHANRREAFGQPIVDFQGIGFRLVDVLTELSAARLMTYEAARQYDRGNTPRELASMAKLYASEAAHRAVHAAVQVLGAAGYAKPNAVERAYRDQRVLEIYEGSSEIQRLTLSRAIKKSYA